MRFIIFIKVPPAPDAVRNADDFWCAEMTAYHEALARAGVLLDAATLQPGSAGWHLHCADGQCQMVDAPVGDGPTPVAAYTVIEARSRAEAMEWVRRFPAPMGPHGAADIEVRPLRGRPGGTTFSGWRYGEVPGAASPSDGSPPDGSPPLH